MGIAQEIAEEQRQVDASSASLRLSRDNRYFQSLFYAFQIDGPDIDNGGKTMSVFIPLVINPRVYRKTSPFQGDTAPTQESGVYVEEQGIIIEEIRLEGHTGWAPRLNPGDNATPRANVPLSGQAHFVRLDELIFKKYSRSKKDPVIGPQVRMVFHNFQDNEHFIVKPKVWALNRTADGVGRLAYPYEITLEVLGLDSDGAEPSPEDRRTISAVKNVFGSLQKAASTLEANVADLAGLDELSGFLGETNADVLLVTGGAGELVRATLANIDSLQLAVRGFLTGVTRTIALPYDAVTTAIAELDDTISIVKAAANLPADVLQILRETGDALEQIGTYPEKFKETFSQAADRFQRLTQGPANSSLDSLEVAAAGTVTQASSLRSSALRPGDLARVNGQVFSGARQFPRYEGFREEQVTQNDTLPKLAARHLGDARRWVDLALANALRAPYISAEGFPGTLRPGDPILVPIAARGTNSGDIRSKGSIDPEDPSSLEALLGRDIELVFDGDGRADIAIESALGSTDVRTLAGMRNLTQAVLFILSVDKGEDLLYLELGVQQVSGRKGTLERLVEAEVRTATAIAADPRIERVSTVNFSSTPDSIEIELNATLIDGTQQRVIGQLIS